MSKGALNWSTVLTFSLYGYTVLIFTESKEDGLEDAKIFCIDEEDQCFNNFI